MDRRRTLLSWCLGRTDSRYLQDTELGSLFGSLLVVCLWASYLYQAGENKFCFVLFCFLAAAPVSGDCGFGAQPKREPSMKQPVLATSASVREATRNGTSPVREGKPAASIWEQPDFKRENIRIDLSYHKEQVK